MHNLYLPLAKGEPSPREKVRQVMLQFKDGLLRTPPVQRPDGSVRPGVKVTSRRQAIAIALKENGLNKASPKSTPELAKAAPSEMHNCADERVAGMMLHADRLLHAAGKAHMGGASDPHVAQMLPEVRRLLGTVKVATPRSRIQNNAAVGDRRQSLAQLIR